MKFGLLELLIIIAIVIQIGVWVDTRSNFNGLENVEARFIQDSIKLDKFAIEMLKNEQKTDKKLEFIIMMLEEHSSQIGDLYAATAKNTKFRQSKTKPK